MLLGVSAKLAKQVSRLPKDGFLPICNDPSSYTRMNTCITRDICHRSWVGAEMQNGTRQAKASSEVQSESAITLEDIMESVGVSISDVDAVVKR
eukprot:2225318-Rhodomonas_salina.2